MLPGPQRGESGKAGGMCGGQPVGFRGPPGRDWSSSKLAVPEIPPCAQHLGICENWAHDLFTLWWMMLETMEGLMRLAPLQRTTRQHQSGSRSQHQVGTETRRDGRIGVWDRPPPRRQSPWHSGGDGVEGGSDAPLVGFSQPLTRRRLQSCCCRIGWNPGYVASIAQSMSAVRMPMEVR